MVWGFDPDGPHHAAGEECLKKFVSGLGGNNYSLSFSPGIPGEVWVVWWIASWYFHRRMNDTLHSALFFGLISLIWPVERLKLPQKICPLCDCLGDMEPNYLWLHPLHVFSLFLLIVFDAPNNWGAVWRLLEVAGSWRVKAKVWGVMWRGEVSQFLQLAGLLLTTSEAQPSNQIDTYPQILDPASGWRYTDKGGRPFHL